MALCMYIKIGVTFKLYLCSNSVNHQQHTNNIPGCSGSSSMHRMVPNNRMVAGPKKEEPIVTQPETEHALVLSTEKLLLMVLALYAK